MFAIIYLLGTFIVDLLKSRRRLEVENLSFPKIRSGRIRAVRENQSIIQCDLWRGAPAANSFFLCGVLQRGSHTLSLEQRRAPGSGSSAVRCHCRHPDPVRAPPSLRPDMIFGKDRCRIQHLIPLSVAKAKLRRVLKRSFSLVACSKVNWCGADARARARLSLVG
jgi:hypothetical protein